MSVSPAPPLPGGSGTFSIATWDIRSGRGAGLTAAAKGLCHLGIGCAVLTETKLTNKQYPKLILGYRVILSKAASPQKGGVALLWRAEHRDFEVKAVNIVSPNILMFQPGHGGGSILCIGCVHPPR
jgi:hypothetical protein